MIRVVIDTNIVVSALLKSESLPAAVLDFSTGRRVQMCISTAVLAEYEDVLYRPYLKLSPARVKAALTLIRRSSQLVVPSHAVSWSKDETDNRLLECAEEAGAHYLITGNLKHFPRAWGNTKVATAREFLADVVALGIH